MKTKFWLIQVNTKSDTVIGGSNKITKLAHKFGEDAKSGGNSVKLI